VLPGAGSGIVCLLLKEGVVCGALNNMTTPITARMICAFFSPDWIVLVWQIWIDLDLIMNAAIIGIKLCMYVCK